MTAKTKPGKFALLTLLLFLPSITSAQTPHEIVAGIDDRIERQRKGSVRIELLLPDGRPVPAGTTAQVTLRRHAFLFGCNLFSYGYQTDKEDEYQRQFHEVFNYATLNFIWEVYEPTRGHSERDKWNSIAKWCRTNGIVTKGHPLVGSMEPAWVRAAGPGEDERLMWIRVADEVGHFKGLIDRWDVINEATEGMKYARQRDAAGLLRAYSRRGTPGTIARATTVARQANSGGKFIVNDFVTTEEYASVLEQAIDAGATFDAIGIQSHMHSEYWRVAKLWEVCNRFARFGKPIHFTELTILSGRLKHENDTDWETQRNDWGSTERGERHQAAQVYETYRVLFSHPSVEAITWWDLSDRGAWMGAPAGLLRYDMSPKPAYRILHELVHKRWHTDTAITVDETSVANVRGFYGDYDVTVDLEGHRYRGKFHLQKRASDAHPIEVKLRPPVK